jgi:hypothetical protein
MLKFLHSLLFGDTFNTRVKVVFINHEDNMIIAEAEIEQIHLPEILKPPLPVFIYDKEWTLVRAAPEHANQYTLDKKLTVWLKDPKAIKISSDNKHPAEVDISFGIKPPA